MDYVLICICISVFNMFPLMHCKFQMNRESKQTFSTFYVICFISYWFLSFARPIIGVSAFLFFCHFATFLQLLVLFGLIYPFLYLKLTYPPYLRLNPVSLFVWSFIMVFLLHNGICFQ